MSAHDEGHLYEQLKAIDMELIKSTKAGKAGGGLKSLFGRITNRDLIQFFVYMEHMQASEIPLLDCLANARDCSDNKVLQDIVAEVGRDIREGMSLSEAMSKHPQAFDSLCLSIISAGEESGSIVRSYQHLIEHLKWVDDMQRRVKKATRYPILVMFVALAAVVIMMAVVVPQITQFFDFIQEGGEELPMTTRSLLMASAFFQDYWWLIMGIVVVGGAVVVLGRAMSELFAYFWDRLILSLPKFGSLVRKINIVRFVKTFSALYTAGIPISDSLKKARDTVENRVLRGAMEDVIMFINNGKSLSEAMVISGEFPLLVTQLVQTGEETGRISSVLDQVSEFYNNDIDEEISGMIALIEPAMTLILGGFILWIAVAVFGPIYSIFEDLDI